jgi:hypothetical protein
VPVLLYFLIVGSALTGLLFFANSVMVPGPLPFSVSQTVGLPEFHNPPMIVIEKPKPVIIETTIATPIEAKKPVKAARKHQPTRIFGQVAPQGRYAAYPPRE